MMKNHSRLALLIAVILLLIVMLVWRSSYHKVSTVQNFDTKSDINSSNGNGHKINLGLALKSSQSAINAVSQTKVEEGDIATPSGDDDYIVECQIDESSSDDYRKELQANLPLFKGASSPELQLVYAQSSGMEFVEESRSKLELLNEFNNRYPEHLLGKVVQLSECVYQNDAQYCDATFEQQIIALDDNNGAIWLQIAALRFQKNDEPRGIAALKNSVSSAIYNEYFAERIQMFNQSMADYSNMRFDTRLSLATGMTGLGGFQELTSYCRRATALDADTLELCLSIGKTMQQHGKVLISEHIGVALQEIAYRAMGKVEIADKLKQQRENYSLGADSELVDKASMLMVFDEGLFNHWLEHFKLEGEVAAYGAAVEEAILLSKNEYYDPCNKKAAESAASYF